MKALAVLTLILALQSAGAQTKPGTGYGPPVLSADFREAGQLAYEAIERLSDYNDKPDLSYEPRRLDAEKDVSEAKRKAKTAQDKHVAKILDNWLSALDEQRHMPNDGRISDASTVTRAYGENSKQAIAANRRTADAQTNADINAARMEVEKAQSTCDSIPQGTKERVDCQYAVTKKALSILGKVLNTDRPKAPLGQTPALDYWEQAIFPCAVESAWYFGDKLTAQGIAIAKKGTCKAVLPSP